MNSSTLLKSGQYRHINQIVGSDTSQFMENLEYVKSVKSFMRDLGISHVGPSNHPLVFEAIRREIRIQARRSGAAEFQAARRFWWQNGATNLNSPTIRRLTAQKEVCSRVMRARGVRSPENAVFSGSDVARAWAWAQGLAPLVVKPFNASKGRGVHLDITDKEAFCNAFEAVADQFGSVLVEEHLQGEEHRVYVVDHCVIAVNKRRPANVVGDGISSIHDLVEFKNKGVRLPHHRIKFGKIEIAHLAAQGLRVETVPPRGERVFLRRTSNLATGGDAVDATDELSSKEMDFAVAASKCWPDMRTGGLDILLPRNGQGTEPVVLEVNHDAGIGGHHFPREGRSRNIACAIFDAVE